MKLISSGCAEVLETLSRYERAARRQRFARGASREVFRLAPEHGWSLIATPLRDRRSSDQHWNSRDGCGRRMGQVAHTHLRIFDDILTVDRPVVFAPAKDRPILFSALAWTDALLTLDRGDFIELLGQSFYDLPVLKPGDFLRRERDAGRLKPASPPNEAS